MWASLLGVDGAVGQTYQQIDKETPTPTDRQVSYCLSVLGDERCTHGLEMVVSEGLFLGRQRHPHIDKLGCLDVCTVGRWQGDT